MCIRDQDLGRTTKSKSIDLDEPREPQDQPEAPDPLDDAKFFGLVDYQAAFHQQLATVHRIQNSSLRKGTVLGFEHPTVITLGKRMQRDLAFEGNNFFHQAIAVVSTDRGGEATLHSPGQLVIYPILHLGRLGIGVRQYVQLLAEVTVQTLSDFGVSAHLGSEPGVFTDTGKIASIGVRVSSGVTRHGLALNLNNDLSLFRQIAVCGVRNRPMDRVLDHGVSVTMTEVFNAWNGRLTRSLNPFTS